jgi:uncharacterized protein (TIGR00369 family)
MKYLPDSEHCFVCGRGNEGGLRRRFYLEGEAVCVDLVPTETHQGYTGVVHGGILSTLLDEAMGWAPCVQHGRFCVAAELQVRFLKPAPVGRKLTVRGWVTGGGRRLWEAAGDVRDEAGTVYARGTGKFVPLSKEETEAVCDQLYFDETTLGREELTGRRCDA